tara:strand:- start:4195 stop:4656 length:462 start_codon:yes stop_codon:yes gene_type:complete
MDSYIIVNIVKGISAIIGGCFFFYVGVRHFTDTEWFEPIVPPILGSAKFWVIVSGLAEILVGLGLIVSGFEIIFDWGTYYSERAGISSAILLVALYPANLYMWIYNIELGGGETLSGTGNIVRLLLQIGGIGISLWISGVSFDSLKDGLSLRN